VHYYDDARYNYPGDTAPKHMSTIMGGNHNFFNTVWTPNPDPNKDFPGSKDDWEIKGTNKQDPFAGATVPESGRLKPIEQQGMASAYMTAFFRVYLGGETQFLPILKGDMPPPLSCNLPVLQGKYSDVQRIYHCYHAPDLDAFRLDLNRFDNPIGPFDTNTAGGGVQPFGLSKVAIVGSKNPYDRTDVPLQQTLRHQPHNGHTSYGDESPQSARDKPGLAQLKFRWNGNDAFLTNYLPPGTRPRSGRPWRDVSGFYALQFRASVNYEDNVNEMKARDFTIELTDGDDRSASTVVSRWSSVLYFPPGGKGGGLYLPKVLLHTARIPLSAFASINLGDVRSVKFKFDQPNNNKGALLLCDIAFVDPAGDPNSLP
jgi:hypothetical protein